MQWFALLLLLLWFSSSVQAAPALQGAIFVVNSTADPGSGGCNPTECTLREAIALANANPGLDTIHFDIPGPGPHTVALASKLPIITSPVIIDGYTQTGSSPNTLAEGDNAVLMIELNGSGAGAGAYGLEITASDSVVRGLVINRFSETGIVIRTGSGSVVAGNFIGVDVTGALDRGNGYDGVTVISSADNLIGGSLPISRNVIAGNANVGVAILNGAATGNRVEGNFIGVGVSGAAAITNTVGGVLISAETGQTTYAMSNTIGGPAGAGNVISGNGYGVQIFRGDRNRVQGNIIGLSSTGVAEVRNATYGVLIEDASHTLVGGAAAGTGNVIAGNGSDGVQIYAATRDAAYNQVHGNVIGGYATLNFLTGNSGSGVSIVTNAIGLGRAISNTVGGMDATDGLIDGITSAGNVILFNGGHGVALLGPRTSANRVSGNQIGSDGQGGGASNGQNGVLISSVAGTTAAFGNLIGGDEAGAGNVISLNQRDGVQIGFGASGNRVVGNIIGLTPDQSRTLGNGRHGVAIFDSPGNIIGTGTGSGSNIIAGNQANGLYIGRGALGGGATANQVLGNEIGSYDSINEEIVALGNHGSGVLIQNGAGNLLAGNMIASNDLYGVVISGTAAVGNQVVDNAIGVDRGAFRHLANGLDGVLINNAPGNFVGEDVADGNFIAGNGQSGVRITGASATGNQVQHNQIGGMVGDATLGGVVLLGNDGNGVALENGASNNTVGGLTANAGNQIVGNEDYGILIFSSAGNRIEGNFVGVGFAGVTAMPNEFGGILVSSAMSNTIGGTAAGAGNVISANAEFGVQIQAPATANRVLGNRIGVTAAGDAALGNDGPGVAIINASGNTIGGAATGAGNVISANAGDGVQLSSGATNNQIVGNRIGTNATGIADLGNGRHGVALFDAANNVIGGTTAGSRNLIAGNESYGVVIADGVGDDPSGNNQVLGNYIGVDISGAAALSNTLSGVFVSDSPTNTIGGLVAGAGNFISGNGLHGVHIFGDGASGNRVLGNIIGASHDGAAALPNALNGVVIQGAPNNRIGDPDFLGRNQISGNVRNGVHILGVDAVGNKVQNNFIGVDFSGQSELGNSQYGVLIEDGDNNLIGETEANGLGGNVIAFNGDDLGLGGHGVVVKSGVANTVRMNIIHDNAGRGIDLGGDSFTIDDLGDDDGGANNLQNFPVVVGVSFGAAEKSIQWFLSGPATTAYTMDIYANEEADPSGFGEGRNWQMAITKTTNITGFVFFTTTHPLADLFIAATATDPAGNTSEFSMIDTDGDALADLWETTGVDVDEDGVFDLLLAGQADPDHKDIFVEIDSMANRIPQQAALDMVAASFAQAPASLVNNPDGAPGVDLHLNAGGDNGIVLQDWNLLNANGWPTEFDAAKATSFGLPAERVDANWPQIRQARALVYRYNIWADTYNGTTFSGIAELALDGGALWGGNDFIVTLGAWQDAVGNPGGRLEDQAGTLMHELGHTLGLRHGGSDHIMYKPNYHSVMNYTWQTPASWMIEDANGDGVLDVRKTDIKTIGVLTDSLWAPVYSDRLFNTLNEASLVETAGVGGHAGYWVRAGVTIAGVARTLDQPESGAVDWNSDGDTADIVADSGINDHVGGLPPTMEPLLPHEDWSKLRYYFVETVDFQDGVHAAVETNEMNLEIKHRLDSLGEGPGFLSFSHTFYDVGESAINVSVQVVRSAGTDGAVTAKYSTLDGTAQAGLDYAPVTGVLTFAPGEYVKTITIPILTDATPEAKETISLLLNNITGGADFGERSVAYVRIADDDATPFVVINTNDSGAGSLRQAILNANGQAGLDVINFAIPGDGVLTIRPLSPLPTISDPLVIDGYTQPGTRPNLTTGLGQNSARLLIQLDMSDCVNAASGLKITAGASTVRGLAINRADLYGIELSSGSGNLIEGNFIGTDAFGQQNAGNPTGNARDGVYVASSNNRIGRGTPSSANIIAFNKENGVLVNQSGNSIRGNSIHSNTRLGIRHNESRAIAYGINDPGDGDIGPNGLQNYPVLHQATVSAGALMISGTLESISNTVYLLDFYWNSQADPTGYGEGQYFLNAGIPLGGVLVNSGPDGRAQFTAALPQAIGFGSLSATATDPQGNTSEFSARLFIGVTLTSSFVVNSTNDNDDGVCNAAHCSLREAIHGSNNHAGADTITFAIPGATVKRISPLLELPAVLEPVTIDGYTQAGALPNTLTLGDNAALRIEINGNQGSLARGSTLQSGIYVVGGHSLVRGLAISQFAYGIWLSRGNENRVEGNFLGVNTAGTAALANRDGILMTATTSNVIGGSTPEKRNLISGNSVYGIEGSAASNNSIQGNYIGVNAQGLSAVGNGGVGIELGSGQGNVIGGLLPGEGNLISGNGFGGVISNPGGISARGETVRIQGNLIGLKRDGASALGNSLFGVLVGTGHIVGGEQSGAGNVISGNGQYGVFIIGVDNLVQGNLIGTDATGRLDVGNIVDGVFFALGSSNNLVGGLTDNTRNVISGNNQRGVTILTSNNRVQGNLIGVQVDGVSPLGNSGHGISVTTGRSDYPAPSNNVIGGSRGNVIAFNGGDGVFVGQINPLGVGNQILNNAIFANGQLGIDLHPDDVTVNDASDADDGANRLQNFPTLSAALTDGSSTIITGALQSTANTTFTVQIFANAACDASSNGEGQSLIDTFVVRSNGTGHAAFTISSSMSLVNRMLSATATDPGNNTSEFSPCLSPTVLALVDLSVTKTATPQPVVVGRALTYTIRITNSGNLAATGLSLTDTLPVSVQVGTPAPPCAVSSGKMICALGSLPGGAAIAVTLVVTPTATGVITNVVTVTTNEADLDSLDNTAVVTTMVANTAPIADAGVDKTVGVGQPVTLDGSGSFDPDGHALSFGWVQSGGPAVSLSSSSAVSPTFTAPGNAGVLTFTLTVTDSFGMVSAADAVAITVTNRAPVANAGLDQTVGVGQPVTLEGSNSFDSDGHALSFGWVQVGGTPVSLSSSSAVSPTFSAPGSAGVLSFTLTVTDSFGLVSAPDTVVVTVTNRAPVANAGPDKAVVVGRVVQLDSSGSFDLDGHAFVRGWRQTGDTPVTLSSTTAVSPTFTPMLTGVFGFALIATDTFGLSSASDSVVVTSINRAPVAVVGGDQIVTSGALVNLDGSGSFDPDQHNIEFAWVQVAGDALALSNAASPKPTFTAPEVAQTLRFELVVSDSFGLTSMPQSTSVMVQTTTPSFELYLPVIQGNR